MNKDSRIFIAGENTMEGKSIIKLMGNKGYQNIINLKQAEPDLTDFKEVKMYFEKFQPEYIFLFAGKSGGIKANQEIPSTLMLNNLKINCNVIDLAHQYRVKKLMFLSRSCTYPKYAKQPMRPEMLMTGLLEPTNSAYAISKLAGIELCKAYQQEHGNNFISVIPANFFGGNDNFNLENSHVIPAIIMKIHKAMETNQSLVELWGTGKPQREFIYIDDLADACLFLMKKYNEKDPINVGNGKILSISELSDIIKSIIGYQGEIKFNVMDSDGMPVKTLDSTKLSSMGWESSVSFEVAIKETYEWFKANCFKGHD